MIIGHRFLLLVKAGRDLMVYYPDIRKTADH